MMFTARFHLVVVMLLPVLNAWHSTLPPRPATYPRTKGTYPTTYPRTTAAPPVPSDTSIAHVLSKLFNSVSDLSQSSIYHFNAIDKNMERMGTNVNTIASDIKKKMNTMFQDMKDQMNQTDAKQSEIALRQSKIIDAVEHFKDINGTKIFDLVQDFNRFKLDSRQRMDTMDAERSKSVARLSQKIDEVSKKLDHRVEDVFVYYPPNTNQFIAPKRYTKYRLQFLGFGESRGCQRYRDEYVDGLDACIEKCMELRRWENNWNGFTYFFNQKKCRLYARDSGHRYTYPQDGLHYMFY